MLGYGRHMRRLSYRFIIIIFLCQTVVFNLPAQSLDGALILTGSAADTTQTINKDSIDWQAKLTMEFVNKGSRPIILINPNLGYGTGMRTLSFATKKTSSGEAGRIAFIKSVSPSENETTVLREVSQDFDRPTPPDNLTLILKPGESFSFNDSLSIRQKFSIYGDKESSHRKWRIWEGILKDDQMILLSDQFPFEEKGFPISRLGSLRVTYEFDIAKYSSKPDLLALLAVRWRGTGILPIDQSGVYTITSEPIVIERALWKVN